MMTKIRIGLAVIVLAALVSGCSLMEAVQAFPWLNPTITATVTPSPTPTPTRTKVTFERWTNTPTPDASLSPEAGLQNLTRTPYPSQTLRPSWTPLPTKTLIPTRTQTFTLTPSITPSPTDTPEVYRFLNETFDNTDAKWYQGMGENWVMGIYYKKPVYEMKITQGNVEITSTRTWLLLDEVRIEADISFPHGEGYAGFNCRESESNYYTLFITSDGRFGVGQTLNGHVEFLYYAASEMIDATPGVYNHVRAECRGNTLTLWVNEVLLAQEEIESYAVGFTGMMSGTRWDDEYVVVHFDNLQVWGPIDFSIITVTPPPPEEEE